MRVAAYVRVSTGDQTAANQLPDLQSLATARGWVIERVYEDTATGRHEDRPGLRQCSQDAHRGAFGVLLVWSLDRLGRSFQGTVASVLSLDRCGVRLVSWREPWLDTSGPVRDLLLSVFAWVAEQEAKKISERTKAALHRIKQEGGRLGRPRVLVERQRFEKLLTEGLSLRQAAKLMGVSATTARRVFAELMEEENGENI